MVGLRKGNTRNKGLVQQGGSELDEESLEEDEVRPAASNKEDEDNVSSLESIANHRGMVCKELKLL